MNKITETRKIDRNRTEAGQINYVESDRADKINEGTIIRPFGGERFDVYRAEHYTYGESRFWNYYGEVLFLGSDTRVELLGSFNI